MRGNSLTYREEIDIGRSHRVIGRKLEFTMIYAVFVGSFRRTANGEVPLEQLALYVRKCDTDYTGRGAAVNSGLLLSFTI